MKFTVLFKTPDAIEYALKDLFRGIPSDSDEHYELLHKAKDTSEKFVSHGEYVNIEFDTETQTATVVPK